MKKMLAILAACCCLGGCVNINARICDKGGGTVEPYMCTSTAAAMSCVIMFPQMMSPGANAFEPINIISVPVGLCCFIIDAPLEFVCDTVCLPYDLYMTKKEDKEYNY